MQSPFSPTSMGDDQPMIKMTIFDMYIKDIGRFECDLGLISKKMFLLLLCTVIPNVLMIASAENFIGKA